MNIYRKIWNETTRYMPAETFDAGQAWEKVDGIHQRKDRSRRRMRNMIYALSGAAAAILVIVVLSLVGQFDAPSDIRMGMRADYGNRSEVKLPDGSVIRLNSGSDITYIYNVKEKIRRVRFQGEGFFDVAKSKEPFVVEMANGLEVKVLGTSFNLQAYAEDPTVQASLVEGSIEISRHDTKLSMKAGDMAVFDKATNKLAKAEGILSHTYGWLENKLYMDDMPLADVCKYLERWYNVEIAIPQGLGETIRYNGVIKEESITDVMDALSRLSKINYAVKGKNISITSK